MTKWKQCHDICLPCDALQLADAFDSFRDLSSRRCGLDPAYCCSTPNFAFGAMLRNIRNVNDIKIIDRNLNGAPLE